MHGIQQSKRSMRSSEIATAARCSPRAEGIGGVEGRRVGGRAWQGSRFDWSSDKIRPVRSFLSDPRSEGSTPNSQTIKYISSNKSHGRGTETDISERTLGAHQSMRHESQDSVLPARLYQGRAPVREATRSKSGQRSACYLQLIHSMMNRFKISLY